MLKHKPYKKPNLYDQATTTSVGTFSNENYSPSYSQQLKTFFSSSCIHYAPIRHKHVITNFKNQKRKDLILMLLWCKQIMGRYQTHVLNLFLLLTISLICLLKPPQNLAYLQFILIEYLSKYYYIVIPLFSIPSQI